MVTSIRKRVAAGILLVGVMCFLGSCQRQGASRTDVPARATPTVAKETPALKANIERVSMYAVPNRPEDLAVTLVVSVGNDGAPTFAKSWMLEVRSPAQRIPLVFPAVHISGSVELPGANGVKTDLAKEDLALKTANSAIPKAGRESGVLTYVLPKTSLSQVSNNNTTLTVQFIDADGNSYKTSGYVVGEKVSR